METVIAIPKHTAALAMSAKSDTGTSQTVKRAIATDIRQLVTLKPASATSVKITQPDTTAIDASKAITAIRCLEAKSAAGRAVAPTLSHLATRTPVSAL